MDGTRQETEDTRRTRATVLVMPQRPQPDDDDDERKTSPPGPDHGESPDEPGYGHGV